MGSYFWGMADHIEHAGRRTKHATSAPKLASGVWWWLFLVVGFLFLAGRLIDLQVVQGAYFRDVADNQRIRLVAVPAPRGLIYDREGVPLVQNVPVYQVLEVTDEGHLDLRNITRDEALNMQSKGSGDMVIEAVARDYTYGKTMAHVLGYIGEVSDEELRDSDLKLGSCPERWRLGGLVGRTGLEQTQDCWLRGKDGTFLVEVDTSGGVVRVMGREDPWPGRRLDLTIDSGLQELVEGAMGVNKGAVIVSTLDGEILSLVSSPSFDPNLFGVPARLKNYSETSRELERLFTDADLPLLNRAVSAQYPPGSIYKMITSTAGLEGGYIDADDVYVDTGSLKIGEYEFRNWYMTKYGGVEGSITMRNALARSTDTYYYYLGGLMGADVLADWSRKFGLGSKTNLGLSGEVAGLVPDPEWKLEAKGERWFLGNTYHMAIGQGDLLVTPLQGHMIGSVVANEGVYCPPKIIKDGVISVGSDCVDLGLKESTLETVTAGMIDACSPGGTGRAFFDFGQTVACKTGTAEFGPRNEKGFRETHAWFTVFGPMNYDKVEPVAITVLVEAGGEGSDVAAPIARKIMDLWFARQGEIVTPTPGLQNVENDDDHHDPNDGGVEEGAVVN